MGSGRGLHQDAVDYETIPHTSIRKVIRLVQPGPDDVVYDMGCGKGRAVCHFARCRTRKIVGIEISEQLCEIARANVRGLRNRKSPVEIINADAARADVSEGTIYYFYNPFGEKTLRDVLRNIQRTHDLTTQMVTIIYMNARFSHVPKEFSCSRVTHDYQRANGHRVVIYRNKQLRTPKS